MATHLVLKTPMNYTQVVDSAKNPVERVVFATGCFWGTEKYFWRFPLKGVISTSVGYTAGTLKNPTYEAVCSGATGHSECVQVLYDPELLAFSDLLRGFWESHDPTQGDGQGNDRGSQYRSGIYFTTDEQKSLAESSKKAYEEVLGRPITTEILPLGEYYMAEGYHQQYLARPENRQYCSAQPLGISLPSADTWIPTDLIPKYLPKLPESFWDAHAPKPGCVLYCPNDPIEWDNY